MHKKSGNFFIQIEHGECKMIKSRLQREEEAYPMLQFTTRETKFIIIINMGFFCDSILEEEEIPFPRPFPLIPVSRCHIPHRIGEKFSDTI